ncbi:MAG: hypothetical protein V5A44_00620 [Haloarculaceae archaeon]
MRRQTVSACVLVALMIASTVAVTVPAAATNTPQSTSAAPAPTTGADHLTDRQFILSDTREATVGGSFDRERAFRWRVPDERVHVLVSDSINDTAYLALDATDDGGLVAGGQSGTLGPNGTINGTIRRFAPDGSTDWTLSFDGANDTRVVDVLAADDGVYFVVSESPPERRYRSTSVRLGHVTRDGDLTWQRPLNATFLFTSGGNLVDTHDGVAVAHRVPERGVRMAEYAGGTVVWEQSFGVRAELGAFEKTDTGFLLAGTVAFDEPWVVQTTESGRPTVNRTYPGIASERVLGATTTDDGGVLLAGRHRPGFGPGGASVWTAGIDADGHVGWTRVHGTGDDVRINRVFDTDEGLLLVGQQLQYPASTGEVRLVGVGPDGAERFDGRVADVPRITALTRSDDGLTAAGLASLDRETFASEFTRLSVPDADPAADPSLEPDAVLTSNETVYRGQDVRVSERGPDETYDLVRLPGEYDEFEPHVVRRIALEDGDAVVETATLPQGEYVLRTPDGQTVAVQNGRITGEATRAEAKFQVREQYFFRVETNRTFVDVASGERRASLTFDSDRSNYDVYVTADRFRGDAASAAELRAAFADADGFEGVETVGGQPAARIEVGEVGDRDDAVIDVTAAGLGPGLYDVTVSGVDTRDGGAVATGRLVVGSDEPRPLGVELGNRTLSVAVGERASTNVTLSNVTHGIGAFSMSADLSGDPLVRLRLRADVNASQMSAGSGIGPRETDTETTAIDGNTANGTVTVGEFAVRAESFGRDPVTTGTNNATFRVDWVVDERGRPYTVPGPLTVTVEVTDAGNATGGAGGRTDSGSEGGSGGNSGSSSGGSSGSDG